MKLYHLAVFVITIPFFSCETVEEKAARIHNKVFTIDSHTDTPMGMINAAFDIGIDNGSKPGSKVDIPRMEKGGLDAAFFAVFLGQGKRDSAGLQQAFHYANKIFKVVDSAINRNSKKAEIALTVEDGFRLEKEGKRAIYLGIENAYAIKMDVNNIDHFHQLGTRYITLVHTANNDIADSSTDELGPEHNGLSDFGAKVVKRMNHLGIIVDVSHASDSAFYDVLKVSKTPVIASHSCARALCDNPRNLTDEMLVALADNGGVIQMCILSNYVKTIKQTAEHDSAKTAFRAKHANWASYNQAQKAQGIKEWYEIDEKYPPILANVHDVVNHIDHIVSVAGIDHVGIGTDFDGGGGVNGCFDASELGNITIELVKRGYTEEEIGKIWGGNFMRVFKEVENFSKKFQS